MNEEQFTDLAVRCQAGEEGAAEQLLRLAFVPVSYQCGRILTDAQEAGNLTAQIMAELSAKLPALPNPANFQKWMQHLIASHCAQTLARLRWEEPEAAVQVQMPELSGGLLDEFQTAGAVSDMLAALPDDERLCAFLHFCGGMSLMAISRGIEMDEDSVRRNLDAAQAAVRQRLAELRSSGVKLLGLGPISMLLHTDMMAAIDPADADALLYATDEEETDEDLQEPEIPEEKPKAAGMGWYVACFILLILNAASVFGIYLQLS